MNVCDARTIAARGQATLGGGHSIESFPKNFLFSDEAKRMHGSFHGLRKNSHFPGTVYLSKNDLQNLIW